MKISNSVGYALLAVGYLAQHPEEKIVLSQTISKQYNIPVEYLLKIMQQLVIVNILRSKRGPRGGFSLAVSANKITMLQVVEAVDGPMVRQLGLAEKTKGKFSVKAERLYAKAFNQAKAVLQKTKISDLL